MELTPKQIESIRLLYGDNADDADYILDLFRKNKIPLTKTFTYTDKIKVYDGSTMKKSTISRIEKQVKKKLFDKDGNINYTIEEFEQWLNFPFKNREYKADSEHLEKINNYFKEIKQLVRQLRKYGSLEIVQTEAELLSNSIKRRSNRLIDSEIKHVDNTIEHLQNRKQELEQDSFIDVI